MFHKLGRFTTSLYNEPLLITKEGAASVFDYLNERNSFEFNLKDIKEAALNSFSGTGNKRQPTLNAEGGVATIEIVGPLSHRATPLEAVCGASSYKTLTTMYEAAIESPDVKVIQLIISSQGGEAAGCFDFARLIREKSKGSGKKVVAYVDSLAASAAYAIASAADEIIVAPEASVGSIGVIVAHTDVSEKLSKEGIKITPIHFGKYKADGNPFESLSEDSKDRIQERVDKLGSIFVSHVANMRGIDEQTVKDTEARVYLAQEAIELGLADNIMSPTQFQDYVIALIEEDEMALQNIKSQSGESMSIEQEKLEALAIELEKAKATEASMLSELENLKSSLKEREEAAQAAAKASLVAKASTWESLGVNPEEYASMALTADQNFVAMFDLTCETAMSLIEQKEAEFAEKLEGMKLAVDESAALEELGVEGEGLSPEDKELAMVSEIIKQRKNK